MFRGKYRIPSCRHKTWNYASSGYYFVTICTAGREHFFGNILRSEIYLSKIGIFANECWMRIPQHFPFISVDAYVIMPNHIHGILQIQKDFKTGSQLEKEFENFKQISNQCQGSNRFGPQSDNLASVIRGYKAAVKSFAVKNNIDFSWQPRYYDHIIRNEFDLARIRQYISNNIANWQKDIDT